MWLSIMNIDYQTYLHPIQSEGARASSDFWAKWILNAASH